MYLSPIDIFPDPKERKVILDLYHSIYLIKYYREICEDEENKDLSLAFRIISQIRDIGLFEYDDLSFWQYLYDLYRAISLNKIPHPTEENNLLDLVDYSINIKMKYVKLSSEKSSFDNLNDSVIKIKEYYLENINNTNIDGEAIDKNSLLYYKYYQVIDLILDVLCINDKLLLVHCLLNT